MRGFLEIAGERYRVGQLTYNQIWYCQYLARKLGDNNSNFSPLDKTLAIVIIVLALLSEHHPDLSVDVIMPYLTQTENVAGAAELIRQAGDELAQQCLAAAPIERFAGRA